MNVVKHSILGVHKFSKQKEQQLQSLKVGVSRVFNRNGEEVSMIRAQEIRDNIRKRCRTYNCLEAIIITLDLF